MTSPRHHIAMHEAGHVVVAVLLGAEGVNASIAPDKPEGGFHCESLTATPLGHAAVSLGGLVGSVLSGDPLGFEGSSDDMRQALEELGDHPNPPQAAAELLLWLLEEAQGSPGFRAMVRSVAHELVENGSLDDGAIRTAMTRVRPCWTVGASQDQPGASQHPGRFPGTS